MARSDVMLFEALADQASVDLLRCLLRSDAPLTQGELASQVGISSGLASKRMRPFEQLGLVERPSSHAPYELVLRAETRSLLKSAADLAASALRIQSDSAEAHARELQKEGLSGGHLRDRERESRGGPV